MTDGNINNRVSGKYINLRLSEQSFNGKYTLQYDTIHKIIDKVLREYYVSQIPDVKIIHKYLMGVIYGYSDNVVKLETIKAFSVNLYTGVKWAMQFEDGAVVNCSIDAPIINHNDLTTKLLCGRN